MAQDGNCTELNDGDTAVVIKGFKVKGMSKTLKRSSQIKGILLTGNDGQIGKSTMVLKTEFMKEV